MAYNGWLKFGEIELVNISRTAQLARTMGIDTVRVRPASVAWVQTALSGTNYASVTTAPWYDPQVPASAEFAGLLPLDLTGINDSTAASTPIEYVGDGGNGGQVRNGTLSMVASAVIVASTARGAEYGKRWVKRVLRGPSQSLNCFGADLTYFREKGEPAVRVHRRDVKMTRGLTVTRERSTSCAFMWWVTFTLTAGDPYEYGEPMPQVSNLGAPVGEVTGPGLLTPASAGTGTIGLMSWASCPAYDYAPVQDPLNPTLLPGPAVPDFYPEGWVYKEGTTFRRSWARLKPIEPSMLDIVPIIQLTTSVDARNVSVSIYPTGVVNSAQCDPLFSVVISYLPAGGALFIDGEESAVYYWDGSPVLRRADSVAYSMSGGPVDWAALTDSTGLMVALDVPWKDDGSATVEGDGTVRATVAFIHRTD